MRKINPKPAASASETEVPADLRKALSASATMKNQWGDLTPIARQDFISWIESAKQSETRKRRVESIGSRLASGKRRICCYAVVPMGLYKALGTNPKAKVVWSRLTPDGRRDFVHRIDSAKDPEAKRLRIDKACATLASGKRRP